MQDLKVKIPPDQFAEPGGGTRVAVQHQPMRCARQQAWRDGAKTQVHAQIAGALDRRKVARVVVPFDPAQKVVEQLLCTTGASGQPGL